MIKIVITYSNTTKNKDEIRKAIETLEKEFKVTIRSNLQNNRESNKKHYINLELETKNS